MTCFVHVGMVLSSIDSQLITAYNKGWASLTKNKELKERNKELKAKVRKLKGELDKERCTWRQAKVLLDSRKLQTEFIVI